MSKRLFTTLLLALLIPLLLTAQNKKKAPLKMVEPVSSVESVLTGGTPITAANYVAVDTMANCYGPAISALNPLDYDWTSGVAGILYRGNNRTYAVGSGELWYSFSTDMGATWTRSATSVQNGQTATNAARYPSACISNSAASTNLADLLFSFSWPDLAASFENVGYGADLGFDGSDLAVIIDDPVVLYSSQVPCWTDNTTGTVFWASDNSVDAAITLWYTNDLYTTINQVTPPEWNDAAFGSGGNITMGGVSHNGIQYYGVIGTYPPEAVGGFNAPGGWELGYSKSTDGGATWSAFNVIDWTLIPTTSMYTEMWDYVKNDGFVSYCGDINVDKDGYVHLVTGLTKIDSAVSSEIGDNALVEFIETASGWDAKIILEGELLADSTFTQDDGTGLGQMGPSPYLAVNEAGDAFVAQWVTSGTPGDSACDVYMSYRTEMGDWHTPMNLTGTDLMNENSSHLAPRLAQNGNIVTALSAYFYEAGNTGFTIDPVGATVVYVAAVDMDLTATAVGDELNKNYTYALDQNYPNPFNPSTLIKYSVPENGLVTLKVYDVLGKEVATLVNNVVTAGQHTVNFNAENLSTGIYFYELSAGDFVQTNKMMLLK